MLESLLDILEKQPFYYEHTATRANDSITEDAESYNLSVDIPGVPKKDINIELNNKFLTISGERKIGEKVTKVCQKYTVPNGVTEEDVSATCEDGVLYVKIKKPKRAPPNRILIT